MTIAKDQILDAANAVIIQLRAEIDRNQDTIAQLRKERDAFQRERDRLKSAVERIYNYPVHSEPVGGAYAMQDIAEAALKGETM